MQLLGRLGQFLQLVQSDHENWNYENWNHHLRLGSFFNFIELSLKAIALSESKIINDASLVKKKQDLIFQWRIIFPAKNLNQRSFLAVD